MSTQEQITQQEYDERVLPQIRIMLRDGRLNSLICACILMQKSSLRVDALAGIGRKRLARKIYWRKSGLLLLQVYRAILKDDPKSAEQLNNFGRQGRPRMRGSDRVINRESEILLSLGIDLTCWIRLWERLQTSSFESPNSLRYGLASHFHWAWRMLESGQLTATDLARLQGMCDAIGFRVAELRQQQKQQP